MGAERAQPIYGQRILSSRALGILERSEPPKPTQFCSLVLLLLVYCSVKCRLCISGAHGGMFLFCSGKRSGCVLFVLLLRLHGSVKGCLISVCTTRENVIIFAQNFLELNYFVELIVYAFATHSARIRSDRRRRRQCRVVLLETGDFFCPTTCVVQQLVLTSSNTRCCLHRMGKDAGNCLFCRNQKQNHHLALVATFRVKTEIPVFSRVLLCEFFCVYTMSGGEFFVFQCCFSCFFSVNVVI